MASGKKKLALQRSLSDALKAGFHTIADDRGSRIADRKMFYDLQRSYGNTLPLTEM